MKRLVKNLLQSKPVSNDEREREGVKDGGGQEVTIEEEECANSKL